MPRESRGFPTFLEASLCREFYFVPPGWGFNYMEGLFSGDEILSSPRDIIFVSTRGRGFHHFRRHFRPGIFSVPWLGFHSPRYCCIGSPGLPGRAFTLSGSLAIVRMRGGCTVGGVPGRWLETSPVVTLGSKHLRNGSAHPSKRTRGLAEGDDRARGWVSQTDRQTTGAGLRGGVTR